MMAVAMGISGAPLLHPLHLDATKAPGTHTDMKIPSVTSTSPRPSTQPQIFDRSDFLLKRWQNMRGNRR